VKNLVLVLVLSSLGFAKGPVLNGTYRATIQEALPKTV
jgi:hypothetical protein